MNRNERRAQEKQARRDQQEAKRRWQQAIATRDKGSPLFVPGDVIRDDRITLACKRVHASNTVLTLTREQMAAGWHEKDPRAAPAIVIAAATAELLRLMGEPRARVGGGLTVLRYGEDASSTLYLGDMEGIEREHRSGSKWEPQPTAHGMFAGHAWTFVRHEPPADAESHAQHGLLIDASAASWRDQAEHTRFASEGKIATWPWPDGIVLPLGTATRPTQMLSVRDGFGPVLCYRMHHAIMSFASSMKASAERHEDGRLTMGLTYAGEGIGAVIIDAAGLDISMVGGTA